jgi:aromatic-L-amino-acid decarboxylase
MNGDKKEVLPVFEWINDYINNVEKYPVLPDIKPFEISKQLPKSPPLKGESISSIFSDFKNIILPGLTHWNHPGFFGYFNSSASFPSIIAESLIAVINTNCMLWKSSPAGTELEQVTLKWLQKILGLSGYFGMILDGGSNSNFHALCAMRQKYFGKKIKKTGFFNLREEVKPRIYITSQTHNSIHKAIVIAGFGLDSIHEVKTNERFEMSVPDLKKAIQNDKIKKYFPLCVIATLGSTSCTAIDPVDDIVKICQKEKLWLHIDAAHGGSAALVDKIREKFMGWNQADSITINPHKWLFVPLDLSVLYVKEPEILKQAFCLSAEYLKTGEENLIESYMDYGLTLGRRFRALKLWFTIKNFGIQGLQKMINKHLDLAEELFNHMKASNDFEIMAPLTLSTVCFRAIPKQKKSIDEFNQLLMASINKTGEFFITHTKLNNLFVLRAVISGLNTEKKHIKRFIYLIQKRKKELDDTF